MIAWAIKLSKFEIIYKLKKAIKAQVLADFVVEMTRIEDEWLIQHAWMLYVNGSSNRKGSGVGVIVKELDDIILEYSLKIDFKATNNEAE